MSQVFATQVDTVLAQIPQVDQEFLNRQFKTLFTTELGYTLVGAKPISITEFVDSEIFDDIPKQKKLQHYLKKIFNKSTSFVCICPKSGEYDFDIGLVNIRSVERIFKKEIIHFRKEGEFKSADEIIFRARDRKKDFYTCLGKDPITRGILFGYGRSNAELFVRRSQLGAELWRCPLVWIAPMPPEDFATPLIQQWFLQSNTVSIPFAIEPVQPQSPFKTLEEEWEWISAVTSPFDDALDPPYLMYKPQFVSKKSAETDSIMDTFSKARTQLGEHFLHGNYLEAVLKIIYDESAP